jgi:hypothetical protein
LQLEQIGAHQRTQTDLSGTFAPAVPRVATQPGQRQVGHHRPHLHRLAGEVDRQRLAHEAAAAVGADQVARPHRGRGAVGRRQSRGDAFAILSEAGQLVAEAWRVS